MSPRTRAYYIHVQDTAPVYARQVRNVLMPVLRALALVGKYACLTVLFGAAIVFGFFAKD